MNALHRFTGGCLCGNVRIVASCWIAVEGFVYDVTEYLPMHPARPGILLEWCGRVATEGMRTKGYGRDHSPAAWAMLDGYRIGALGG